MTTKPTPHNLSMNLTRTTLFLKLALAALPLLSIGTLVDGAIAPIISLNVRDGAAEGNTAINGTETFGLASLGTVLGNWNNTNSFGAGAPTANLIDSAGVPTGVSATILNGGGQQYWGATYINTAWNYGIAAFPATTGSVSVTLTNLNAQFASGYYAIVYVNGPTANTGAAVTDGSTTYYFRPANPASLTPVLITDVTTSDGYDVGNYALFGSESSPLNTNSITFTIPTGSIVAGNAGIGGVQLVAVPEPAAFALLAGFATLGLILVRRRSSRSF